MREAVICEPLRTPVGGFGGGLIGGGRGLVIFAVCHGAIIPKFPAASVHLTFGDVSADSRGGSAGMATAYPHPTPT